MADPRITDEAVEAAVKSLHPDLFEEGGLLHPMLANSGRWAARHKVRAALEAALPHLAPQPPTSWLTKVQAYRDEIKRLIAVVPSGVLYLDHVLEALDAALADTELQPVVDREALRDLLTGHWFVYIGEEEGFDCGCNEHGTLPGMPTVTEAASHLADAVLALINGDTAKAEPL